MEETEEEEEHHHEEQKKGSHYQNFKKKEQEEYASSSCSSEDESNNKKKKKKAKTKSGMRKGKQKKIRVNPCLVFLNILFACVGVAFIGIGVWISLNHGTNCVHFLQTFLVGVGLFMVAVAASGIVGAIWSILWLLYLNFIVMLLLLLLVVGTTVFVLVITSHGISASIKSEHSNHNPLSGWLRDRVNQRIRSCTQNGQICNFVQYTYSTGYYSRPRLSDLQRACCEAPSGCNSNNVGGNDTAMAMAIASDCEAWRKAGTTTGFCSHCSLCRAAVTENIRHVWHTVAIFKIIMLLILLPAYFITCCNFKQDDSNGYSRGGCRQCLDCCFNVL